jgi:hypothetical protein
MSRPTESRRAFLTVLSLWLAALALSPVLVGPAMAQPLSLQMISRDPGRFDHRHLILVGSIGFIEGNASTSMGVPGQAFTFIDSAISIRVVGPLPVGARPGDRVEVEGTYIMAGNLIEAIRVTPR